LRVRPVSASANPIGVKILPAEIVGRSAHSLVSDFSTTLGMRRARLWRNTGSGARASLSQELRVNKTGSRFLC